MFLLQPLSILALTQSLLLFIVALYLLSIKRKTRGTRLLAIAFGIISLTWLEDVLRLSLYTPLPFDIDPLDELTIPLFSYTLLHFAYSFVSNPFRRESRIVLTGAGLLAGGNAVYQIYRMITFTGMPRVGPLCIEVGILLMILVSLSVYLRKRAHLLKDIHLNQPGSPERYRAEQAGKASQSFGAFALLTAGMMLTSIRGVWVTATFIWPELGTPSPLMAIVHFPVMVLLIVLFLVVYLNHMPEPTTFQAKIIGLSLATVLAVLGIADLLLFSKADLQREGMALLPDYQTLRFEPDGQGGYRVAHIPFQFDADIGDNLGLRMDTETPVSLGFAFPFSGTQWEKMYIDSNGLVSFGAPYPGRHFDDFYRDEHPKIAPYYRYLAPLAARDSGIFYKQESGKVTVTWLLVWERLSGVSTNRNTVQLVLYERGAIDFVYDRMDAPLDGRSDGLRGLHPGGAAPPLETVFFTEIPSEGITAGSLPGGRSIRFDPTGNGDYRYSRIPFNFDPDMGQDLNLGDDTNARISFDFPFPFYETRWQEAYVSANGAVAFGSPINPPDSLLFRPLQDFFNAQPKIAPFFVDLNPAQGGGVFHKHQADRATITWYRVPLLGTPFTNSVQLVLHERGTVDFVYEWVGVPLYGTDFWGLYPGDARPRINAAQYLFDGNAYPAPGGVMLVEDFNLLYRRFVHGKIVPLAYVVLMSTLFVLGVFPFFFRTSLIKPLEALLQGVRRVDEGDLDIRVPVRVNDEIGILSRNFNRMAASLKTAEEQLRAYTEGLEEKVAERTANLQQALQHLTETQNQLIHAEKMSSLGSLTAGIAHEIKNPLNFINNFSQLSVELAEELESELAVNPERPTAEVLAVVEELLPDLKQNAAKIHEHGRRADSIVRSMLEHSRSGAGERRAVGVNELLRQYLQLAYQSMRAATPEFNVTIEKDLRRAVGKVEMAPQEIGRVFINLLKNAFYAVQERSRSSNGPYTPMVKVRTRRTGGDVEIQVCDNGPGIAAEIQEKIFEPFFTTKPTGMGTGLGLSLSYDIVIQGHGGTLTVKSEKGQGATFIVRLPARKTG